MPHTLYILQIIGTVAFALSGMIAAKSKDMDPVGVYTIAFITALGGGTLRDLILNNHPLYWIQHQEMPILILVMALAFSYIKPLSSRVSESTIVLPDAIGLGIFSILGAQLAVNLGNSLFIASLLGVITGTFGGALRDTLCHQMPFIFRKDQVYASVSFAGCWFYFLCNWLLHNDNAATILGLLFIAGFRMLAVRFDIRLQRQATPH